ncbi:MAG: sigma-54 dependent transcriptional regulator [candidate division KSB1 bacterium]|nr:sigma-54 dependent transcriptional regulator [candidate division KSB1 bacterium]MDZ7319302.1 sigma-54 dependent transcriptional regulator [candidate division KSB1 bacterium]MDZ7340878.1 sigma-54 dependent transcriptional regulator [candidate division KSB1 bacterium]
MATTTHHLLKPVDDFEKFQRESGLLGQSLAIRQIFETIEQVAPSDIAVLIVGESGTGKELVARAIHQRSRRRDQPLIIVNCGAIPEGIIESELFGHEKGAFTGAVGFRKGFFEMADGGTIFLDEIGEMPLNAQVKILRVLEGKEFTRVGSASPKQVNVRIIAATNRELDQEVRNGTFRQDLYFRLHAITIQVPPLRTRKEDIPMLAREFATKFALENHIDFEGFDESAFTIMKNYHWPGNVRELKNLIESLIILEKGHRIDEQIMLKHLTGLSPELRHLPMPVNRAPEQVEREFIYRALLDLKTEIAQLRELILTRFFPPRRLKSWVAEDSVLVPQDTGEIIYDESVVEPRSSVTLEEMEKKLIEETLARFDGNKRKAARSLKISERTLYRKIKEYNLPF